MASQHCYRPWPVAVKLGNNPLPGPKLTQIYLYCHMVPLGRNGLRRIYRRNSGLVKTLLILSNYSIVTIHNTSSILFTIQNFLSRANSCKCVFTSHLIINFFVGKSPSLCRIWFLLFHISHFEIVNNTLIMKLFWSSGRYPTRTRLSSISTFDTLLIIFFSSFHTKVIPLQKIHVFKILIPILAYTTTTS